LPEVAKVITFAGIFVLMKPSRGENMAREGFCPDIGGEAMPEHYFDNRRESTLNGVDL
jgi:hypothetical protein